MLRVFNYQVRGRQHERAGTVGQDRTAYRARSGTQAVCLADGAGSAKMAEFGAQRVVDAGSTWLVENAQVLLELSDDEVRAALLFTLITRLEETASRMECELRDLASTFLAAVATKDKYMVVHVGDGVVGAEDDGRLVVLSSPDNGEFANETVFVTSPRAADSMRVVRGDMSSVRGFILMSDGTAESLHNQRTDSLAKACSKLMQIVADGHGSGKNPEFKKQLRRIMDTVIRDRTDDDCSVAILARRSGRTRMARADG